jgi:hypothetical protein
VGPSHRLQLTELEIQLLGPTSLKLVRIPGEDSLKKDPIGHVLTPLYHPPVQTYVTCLFPGLDLAVN